MSFWTDSLFITAAEVASLDPEVPAICTNMGLNLEGNLGLIQHGIDEAGITVMSWLQSAVAAWSQGGVSPQHMAAVLGTWGNRLRTPLSSLVVEGAYTGDWSALKRWVAYSILYHIYTTASDRVSIDRYQSKAERTMHRLQYDFEPLLWNNGIAAVQFPLACPTSRLPGVGVWDGGDVSVVDGGSDLSYACDLALTYTGPGWEANDDFRSMESAPSARVTGQVPDSSVLQVSIARLNPAAVAKQTDTRQYGISTPMSAAGWRIWAGEVGGTLYAQTPAPLPIAQLAYTFPGRPVFAGTPAGIGQAADGTLTLQRLHFVG